MGISSEGLTTDVLVVGAGFAGCFAAMRARELGVDVVVVEQGKSGLWGESAIGPNAWRVHHPEDDFDTAMEGTVLECEYMIDQECAEVSIRETWDRFQDLLKIGVNFRRDDKGDIQWYFKDTLYPPFIQRVVLADHIGNTGLWTLASSLSIYSQE